MNVKVIQRQSSETSYNYVVPGHFNSSSNTNVNCNASSTNMNCTGTTQTNGTSTASKEISYNVMGATFSLLLPDGRVAVVNCANKPIFNLSKGDYIHYRSCRMPLVDDIQVEFKGKNAKLIWPVSLDGKKLEAERYKILAVFGAVPTLSQSAQPENRGMVGVPPVTAKDESVELVVGTYGGLVHNQTAHQSAGFAIFVRSDAGKVEGCMGVQKPLIGSGTLHGQVKGSTIDFTVNADTFDLFFRGNIANNTITGTYNVSPINGAVQEGDFYLERFDAEVPADEYVQDCLTDAEMKDK